MGEVVWISAHFTLIASLIQRNIIPMMGNIFITALEPIAYSYRCDDLHRQLKGMTARVQRE